MRKTLEERFWEKVDRRGDTECWKWSAGLRGNTLQYGSFRIGDKKFQAQRVAYALAYGVELLPEQQVLHRCDNPRCCNPGHLFLGSNLDNMKDKAAKGRSHNGGRGKLTADQVWDILVTHFELLESYKATARQFGVTAALVSCICRGIYWAGVYEEYLSQARKQAA